jgi:hypothetical protein
MRWLAVAAVATIGLAACSSGSGAAKTGSSGGSGGSGGVSSSAPASVNALALVTAAGRSSQALHSAHIHTVSTLAGKTTTTDGDIAFGPTRLRLAVDSATGKTTEVVVGSTIYLQLPQSAGTGSKKWFSLSVARMSKVLGIDFNTLLNNATPDQMVQLMSKAGDLKYVGSEDVGGVSTRHLAGTVDLSKALGELGATSSGGKTLTTLIQSLGVKDSHIDLWVNAQNVPVKTYETYTSKLGAATTTQTITKINAPVTITAPPASDVQAFPL